MMFWASFNSVNLLIKKGEYMYKILCINLDDDDDDDFEPDFDPDDFDDE